LRDCLDIFQADFHRGEQSQRSTMLDRQWLSILTRREQGLWMTG
jgi:hypothetical protein